MSSPLFSTKIKKKKKREKDHLLLILMHHVTIFNIIDILKK